MFKHMRSISAQQAGSGTQQQCKHWLARAAWYVTSVQKSRHSPKSATSYVRRAMDAGACPTCAATGICLRAGRSCALSGAARPKWRRGRNCVLLMSNAWQRDCDLGYGSSLLRALIIWIT
eukprot:6208925-Pleurochrysis_carterae.AAC.1